MTRLLRIKQVQDLTTLSPKTIRKMARTNRFPKPIVLGTRTHVWNSDHVEKWVRQLPQKDSASGA